MYTVPDTGSEMTLFPPRLVPAGTIIELFDIPLHAVNNPLLDILISVKLLSRIGIMDIELRGLMTEHFANFLIGEGRMQTHSFIWNHGRGMITIFGNKHVQFNHETDN